MLLFLSCVCHHHERGWVCCFFGELTLGSFILGIMKLFFLLAFSACESDWSWIKAAIRTQSSVRTPSKSHYWSDCVITWLSLNPGLQHQKETLPPSRALMILCHDLQLIKEIVPKLLDSLKKQPTCKVPFCFCVSQSMATHISSVQKPLPGLPTQN